MKKKMVNTFKRILAEVGRNEMFIMGYIPERKW